MQLLAEQGRAASEGNIQLPVTSAGSLSEHRARVPGTEPITLLGCWAA